MNRHTTDITHQNTTLQLEQDTHGGCYIWMGDQAWEISEDLFDAMVEELC